MTLMTQLDYVERTKIESNVPRIELERDKRKKVANYYENFKGQLEVVATKLSLHNKMVSELVMFLGQVSKHYKTLLADLPTILMDFMKKYATLMHPETRMALCRGLVLLRNRQLIEPLVIIQLFFSLLSCQDKELRDYLRTHIISDISNLNSRHQDHKLNTALQNYMFSQMAKSSKAAVKMSLDIMINLYRKNIWRNAKTVNVIASACFSHMTQIDVHSVCVVQVMVGAHKFFLTADEEKLKEESGEEDNSNMVEMMRANKYNKKSKKRKMMVKKVQKVIKKSGKKNKGQEFHFSAILLIYDPQEMAEKLLSKVKILKEGFEVKMLMMELISRLIGLHELMVPNFYSHLIKLIQPHQKEVTKILLFLAQSTHQLVPPEDIQGCVHSIANNFVTDRSSVEVMTVGLNAIREICNRNPHAITEELLQDLVQYRYHKHKNVVMAANSLMKLYRDIDPNMLNRKDRGRPTQAMAELELPQYGELTAKEFIPGAEVLGDDDDEEAAASKKTKSSTEKDDGSKEDDSEEEWEDEEEEGSDDEEEANNDEEEDDEANLEDDKEETNIDDDDEANSEDDDEEEDEEEEEDDDDEVSVGERLAPKPNHMPRDVALQQDRAKAIEISHTRIFSQEDFRKMKAAQLSKKLHGALPKKLKRRAAEMEEEEEESEEESRGDLPSLGDIERVHKRFKLDKETRLATAMELKKNKPKFKLNTSTGDSNRVKKKNKPFQMVKHKYRQKAKRSFKQRAVSFHLD
ncbi:SDAD1 [Cordylochernes scorpioides]|uniref:Protein SDA1 n=1 Tax=Cordylochernes scorpioides TaxID=51811 RepID=A0ABY6K2N4_9ARAC|nr:SDAD1 [Cordylochernes scorpioides]